MSKARNNSDDEAASLIRVDDEVLRNWPLPMPPETGGKETRGEVLLIAGSREMVGSALLAANSALRAGAGKITIATAASVAGSLALAVPEARVIALPETAAGAVSADASGALDDKALSADAVLIGPGMQDESAVCELVAAVLPKLPKAQVILDAFAMGAIANAHRQDGAGDSGGFLVTPHAGEMAHLTGKDVETVRARPEATAKRAAELWNAVVILKGVVTFIARPEGTVWRHKGGNAGLGISGSGDTLSGIAAGLIARGASVEQAAVWAVSLHAKAGERLADRMGPLGYLPREIPAELPAIMHSLRPRP